MTIGTNDMTFVTNGLTTYRDTCEWKMSYHDKNVVSPQAQSESAGYVKVKLIAGPLNNTIINKYTVNLFS